MSQNSVEKKRIFDLSNHKSDIQTEKKKIFEPSKADIQNIQKEMRNIENKN